MYLKANYSQTDPNYILLGIRTTPCWKTQGETLMYYNWKLWAKINGADGRLPLFAAAARSLKWFHVRQIFNANMPLIQEIDVLTGLPVFMLAAVGPTSDMESIYNLLKEYPSAICFTDA